MARLNEACESFIASLEKAQAELDLVRDRLEEEFEARCPRGEINPMDLVARIHRLRAELPALAAECAEVLQAKADCVDAAKASLGANCEALGRLRRRAGIEAEPAEEDAAFRAAVGELEQKLRLGAGSAAALSGGAGQITREELNQAIVQSVIT